MMNVGTSLLASCLLATALSAQVVISEISPTAGSGTAWIELHNTHGTQEASLGTWSLYQATKTPGRSGNYWFAFPSGTTIPPLGFLRVHWLAPLQASPPAGELYTGDTVYHFLFGYGAEPMNAAQGAFALLSSQQNTAMNNPATFVDWISWGDSGFPREALAVQGGRWTANQVLPAPAPNESIALIYSRHSPTTPTPLSALFRDTSPTPREDNVGPAAASAFGDNCDGGSITLTTDVDSVPALGNRDFRIRIGGTDPSHTVALFFSDADDPMSTLTLFHGCKLYLRGTLFIGLVKTGGNGTTVFDIVNDLPLQPAHSFASLSAQALVFGQSLAMTRAVRVTVGL